MVELWADSARMTTCGYCRGDSAKLIFNGCTCHMVELKLTATVRTSADRLRPYPSGSEDIILAESSGTLFSDLIREECYKGDRRNVHCRCCFASSW